ncbi:MAG: CBS domain-containing protein [Nitrospirae bacterium]|nr:MAG: CBS domain-containing protein [Nitrospirota bacterium]
MGGGLGAVALIRLLAAIDRGVARLQAAAAALQPAAGPAARVAVMAAAGVAVGWVIERWAHEAKGHGVPEVMEAVAVAGGRIRARVAALKLLCSAVTIGVGGSAGREGPIVQVGASLGSLVGQLLRFGSQRLSTLVACGAAAGIAATFNAPIAGALFALEVVLGTLRVAAFGAVVISSVAASVVARAWLSAQPAFAVPAYPFHAAAELPLYALLGVAAGGVAALFIHLLYRVEDRFDAWRVWPPLRYGLGMALVAGVGLVLPESGVLGPGLHRIGETIAADVPLPLRTMALLLLLKLAATCLTLGSGNSGGVFAPSLFMGATLGGIVGSLAHAAWPGLVAHPGAYCIAGMAAVFAGAARAPITAVLIVFEMSGDYALILPLMLATVVAAFVAQAASSESIYTAKLARKGIHLEAGRDTSLLAGLPVEEVMDEEVHAVPHTLEIAALSDLFAQTGACCVAVLHEDGRLWGVVHAADLERALHRDLPPTTPVRAIATPLAALHVVHPDESAADALARMGLRGEDPLPVVTRGPEPVLVGVLHHDALMRAYATLVAHRRTLHHRAAHARARHGEAVEFLEVALRPGDRAVGRRVGELGPELPADAILISVRRDGRTLIPHGATRLLAGDRVTAYAHAADTPALLAALRGPAPEAEPPAEAEAAGAEAADSPEGRR